MDVFLLLFVTAGLLYAFIRGVRWAIRLDDTAKKHERIRRRDRRQINEVFEDIIRPLRKTNDA